jgi:hypothetical protein
MSKPTLSFYGHVFTGFAFLMPCIGYAQAAAAPAPVPSAIASLIAQYLPLLLLGLVTVFLSFIAPKVHAFIDAHVQSATATATEKAFYSALRPVEHLAETIALKMKAQLAAGAKSDEIFSDAVTDLKSALGEEGAADLQQVLGVGGNALTQYLGAKLVAKVGVNQLTAATIAGKDAAAKVASESLPQLAAALAAGPKA